LLFVLNNLHFIPQVATVYAIFRTDFHYLPNQGRKADRCTFVTYRPVENATRVPEGKDITFTTATYFARCQYRSPNGMR